VTPAGAGKLRSGSRAAKRPRLYRSRYSAGVLDVRGPGRRAGAAILLPFCLGYFVSYVLRAVNAVIAPDLVRELHLGAADLGFLTSTYSLTFALAQLPVGLALDRFGSRRVVGGLLVLAALGTAAFAWGHGFAVLALGRGLAGLGVSACLMGAFKVFGDTFPRERQASLTGMIMAAGTSGALAASAPLSWALPLVGWRGALGVVAGLCALAALLVLLVMPPAVAAGTPGEPPRSQVRALGAVFRSRPFWRYAPQTLLFTGGFMALQGLWFAAWFTTVEGRSPAHAAALLFVVNLGLLLGQLAISATATRLARAGLSRERLMAAGLALAMIVEGLLFTRIVTGTALWMAFGFFNAASAQVYGVATSRFPPAMAGRVSTALNLMAFAGAFAIQWGIGVAVQAMGGAGHALQVTFVGLWVAQTLAVGWSVQPDDR
jgi:predicted MFS family arabinose efflux permease